MAYRDAMHIKIWWLWCVSRRKNLAKFDKYALHMYWPAQKNSQDGGPLDKIRQQSKTTTGYSNNYSLCNMIDVP